MNNAQKLTQVIQQEVLPDIEDYLDELFELVASKKATDEDREQIADIREMQTEFKEMLKELENDELDEEECLAILEEIEEMKKGQ